MQPVNSFLIQLLTYCVVSPVIEVFHEFVTYIYVMSCHPPSNPFFFVGMHKRLGSKEDWFTPDSATRYEYLYIFPILYTTASLPYG